MVTYTDQAQYRKTDGVGENPQINNNLNWDRVDKGGGWASVEIETGHGGTAGQWYTFNAAAKAIKADAADPNKCRFLMMLTADKAAGLEGLFLKHGNFEISGWALTAGQEYWLTDDGSGDMRTTPPVGSSVEVFLGVTLTTEILHIQTQTAQEAAVTEAVEIDVYNDSGAPVVKGKAVYVSGYDAGTGLPEVTYAQSNAGGTMPALGLVKATIGDGAAGKVIAFGMLGGFDTSTFAIGDLLFVDAAAAGDLTDTEPTGGDRVQVVAQVIKDDASDGRVKVMCTGRSENDHTHDGDTLQLDGINSDGGAFAFTTSGAVTFSQDIIVADGDNVGAAGLYFTFNDTTNVISVTGGSIVIGNTVALLAATYGLEIYADGADVGILIHEDAGTHEAVLRLRSGSVDWEIINDGADLVVEFENSKVFGFSGSTFSLADGASFSLQEDITWTGATTENQVIFPNALAVALDFNDGTDSYMFFDTANDNIEFGVDLIIPDGGTVGNGVLLTFDDTNNFLQITGCRVGIGAAVTPAALLDVEEDSNILANFGRTGAANREGAINVSGTTAGNAKQSLYLGCGVSRSILKSPTGTSLTFASNGGDDHVLLSVAGVLSLADGISFALREDIEWTGATTENLIKFPDHLAVALRFAEGANPYMDFVSTNGSESVTFYHDIIVPDGGDVGAAGLYFTFDDTNNRIGITGGDLALPDSIKILFGTAQDVDMYYDGGDFLIHTDLVAPSDLVLDCGTAKTLELTEPVYDDLVLPLDGAKVPAVNDPSWEAFVGNLKAYAYAVNDFQEYTVELLHGYKEGSTFEFHIHGALNAIPGNEQTVKFEIEYSIADMDPTDGFGDVFPAPTIISAELIVPNATADLTNVYISIGTDATASFQIGATIKGRIRRIASSGVELVGDMFMTQVGVHYQINTMGSRQETVK